MSGKEPIGDAIDQILQNVDLASIQDVERARECIRLLLNLLERVYADLGKAQAEIEYLREPLQGRKGGGGDRGSEGSGSGEAEGTTTGTTSRSSEKGAPGTEGKPPVQEAGQAGEDSDRS